MVTRRLRLALASTLVFALGAGPAAGEELTITFKGKGSSSAALPNGGTQEVKAEWHFIWNMQPFENGAAGHGGHRIALRDSTVSGTVTRPECSAKILFYGPAPKPGQRRPPGYPGWAIQSIKGHNVHFLLPIPMSQESAFTGNTMFGTSEPQTACGVWGAVCFDTARIKKGGYGNITFNDKKREVVTENPSPSCTTQTADGTNTVSWSGKIKAYDGDPPPPKPGSARDPLAWP